MSESDPDLTKISLNEKEQELYDVLLDEYNDIFENILNLSETEIFDKILINSKAILGHKKIEAFSEDIISRIITSAFKKIFKFKFAHKKNKIRNR